MSKLRIERGASRVRRVPLKTTIEGAVADDIELMCQWSENETSYIVTELLRFALTHSDEFQAYKQSHPSPSVAANKVDSSTKLDRPKERVNATSNPSAVPEVVR